MLDALDKDSWPKNDYNLFQTRSILLAQLDGTLKRYTRVNLTKHRRKPYTEEELEFIRIYTERTSFPPPPAFDTLKLVVHVIDEENEIQ